LPTPGPLELVIILVIALLVLGPGKLPDVGAALGKGIREFRKAASDVTDAAKEPSPSPAPPAASPAAPPSTGEAPAAPPSASGGEPTAESKS
jgi:sec-independent protein translocase protein TatA